MICDSETIQNILQDIGILFFKYTECDGDLSYDTNKLNQMFPHFRNETSVNCLKNFYKSIYYQDRVIFRKYLRNIDKENENIIQHIDIRYLNHFKDETIWLRVQVFNKQNKDNVRYGSIQNITSDKINLVTTARKAYIDNLTGLMNRERLKQKLALAIGIAHEYKVEHCVIAFNIDYLSTINSMFGYQITNDLIEEISKKIVSIKRSSDIIARISSGKFAIVLIDTKDIDLQKVGERFLDAIRNTHFRTRSGLISVSVSGAGCKIPQDANTDDTIFTLLEECLTKAKKRGRDNFVLYSPQDDNRSSHQDNITISGQIIEAIKDNKIFTAYQPILHAHDTSKSFMECLARIQDSNGNFIPAYKFINVAENIGFIKNIDYKLLERALADLTKYPHLKLSVNLSGYTLYNISHNSKIIELFKTHTHVADRLYLELTETIPLQDIENLDIALLNLREMGYKIALDDFGSGYNSFANLYHFDFDLVKIDGKYVKNIASNHKKQIFTQTLAELSQKLGMEIVAEMIDNQEDLAFIKALNIDYFQGFYFMPPNTHFNEVNTYTYDLNIKSQVQ